MNKLAGVFQSRMKSLGGSPRALDFGTINGDMSLTTNGFPQPIPKNDYMVCRLAGGLMLQTAVAGEDAHTHAAELPKVKPGDRVLVAWAGDDACVLDVIVPGSAL